MPRTKRDNLKRKWAQARYHLWWSVQIVMELQEIFKPQHPIYAKLLEYVSGAIYMAVDGLEAFCKHAWGKVPEDNDSWRL
jgi:hypothetical protein